MINFLFINWNEIEGSIIQGLRTLCGTIAGYIYDFIAILYNLFLLISRAEFLDNDFVTAIYRKVGLILGLFMIFKLSFSLIKSLVDPDKLTDNKTGFTSIIFRCIISIVLLGITPTIFKEAFSLQRLLVGMDNSENIIYKIIIGKNMGTSSDFGVTLSSELFFSFFTDNEYPYLNGGNVYHEDQEDLYTEDNYENIKKSILNNNGTKVSFTTVVPYLSAVDSSGNYLIEFDVIFSLIVGGLVAWMLILYCVQTGIRVVQLAYLQLIAPIPIFSYISDPDGAFKRWLKQCATTYLDLFIRLAIIYFIVYLSTYILQQFDLNNLDNSLILSTGLQQGTAEFIWVKIFLILGLLLFAKKVPNLIKDLFPNMGGGTVGLGFGLKAPKEVSSFAKGAATFGVGAVVGGVAGMATGLRHGEGWRKVISAPGGFIRGALSAKTKGNIFDNAKKGMANVRAANAKAYERHHDGSTFFGRMAPVHAGRVSDEYERELQAYDDYVTNSKIIDGELLKNATLQHHMNRKQILLNRGANGGPVATPSEIAAVEADIKAARTTALQQEIAANNATIVNALNNAEKMRQAGKKNGYAAFQNMGDITQYADDFEASVKDVKKETGNIKSLSGSRNDSYEKAKANSKYKPK